MNRLEFPFEMPVSRYQMKKLPQSAGTKATQNSRSGCKGNYQVGATKKRSVLLSAPEKKSEPENSAMAETCAPKGKPRRKLKRGQPNSRRKLTAVDPIDRPRTLLPTHEMSDFELRRHEWADAAMAVYGVSPDS